MNTNYINTQTNVLFPTKDKGSIRNPDITGNMMISWFEEPFKSYLDRMNRTNFRELANLVYQCIIDVDDQIDLNLGNLEPVSNHYIKHINNLSISCNLSDNFRKKVYNIYSTWMSAENSLKYSLFVQPSENMHKYFLNKVSFLKLIPTALGELTGNEEISKLLGQAYDYAAIANGYIDDLIDFENDKVSKNTHLLLGLFYSNDEKAKKTFLQQYLNTAIKFNSIASTVFSKAGAITWKDYCEYQNSGSRILLSMLNASDSNYVLKNATHYLKGT